MRFVTATIVRSSDIPWSIFTSAWGIRFCRLHALCSRLAARSFHAAHIASLPLLDGNCGMATRRERRHGEYRCAR